MAQTNPQTKKPLPETRKIKRVWGDQDTKINSSPRFKAVTVEKIKNIESISSHAYIKEASESGGGFSIWKSADKKYNLAINKIYIREDGFLKTNEGVGGSDTDYVYITSDALTVDRTDDTGTGSNITILSHGTDCSGLYTEGSGAGDGITAVGGATGYAVTAQGNIRGYSVYSLEKASAAGSGASYGQFWVKNDDPNNPRFTNGDGGSFILAMSDGTTGGSGSAGAGNQYVEINIANTTYKVLHDGTA